MNLRIPGPIPVPGDVLEAMSGQMINHRGPQFEELLYRVSDGIRSVFETDNDVYVLTASGTGAMEAAVVNTLSPGDRVLNLSIGFFGERFGEIARIYGAEVTELAFPWGRAVDVDDLRQGPARRSQTSGPSWSPTTRPRRALPTTWRRSPVW